MENTIIQYVLYLAIVIALAIPLGNYIGKVMNGERVFLSKILLPVEKLIYKFLKIDSEEEMTWKKYGVSWHLAFNTAISFVTNTNWQAYSGEIKLSYFTQMIGLTVQNFVSAAVGISVLFVVVRGFIRTKQEGLGNFWADFTRIILYVLMPLSLHC